MCCIIFTRFFSLFALQFPPGKGRPCSRFLKKKYAGPVIPERMQGMDAAGPLPVNAAISARAPDYGVGLSPRNVKSENTGAWREVFFSGHA
jgi:hypothetical protein